MLYVFTGYVLEQIAVQDRDDASSRTSSGGTYGC